MSGRFSYSALRDSNAALSRCENIHGTDAAVLVPHDQALSAVLMSLRAASSGVVLRL